MALWASCYGVRLGRCVVWRLQEGGFGMADLFTSEVCVDEVNVIPTPSKQTWLGNRGWDVL